MKTVIVNDSKEKIEEGFLNQWVGQISVELLKRNILTTEQNEKEISLVFLEERDAKRINWQFRTKDYATDVLSFSTDDPQGLGELVLCPFVISRQATEHKLKFEQELAYLVLHGILHLLGYDHEKSPEEEKKMMSLQDEIFEKYILKKDSKKSAKASVKATAKAAPAKAKASAKTAKTSPKAVPDKKKKLSVKTKADLKSLVAQKKKSAKDSGGKSKSAKK